MSNGYCRDAKLIADHVNGAIRSGVVDYIVIIRDTTTGVLSFHNVGWEEHPDLVAKQNLGYQRVLVAVIAQSEPIEPQLAAIPSWSGNAATIDTDRHAAAMV